MVERNAFEIAMSKFWAQYKCHRLTENAVYCGLCDSENGAKTATWRDVPHEAGCAFVYAKQATGEG